MIKWLSTRAAPTAHRNATITQRRLAGETLAAIAADYGICTERVRQISNSCERKFKSMQRLAAMRHEAELARQAMKSATNADSLVPISALPLPVGIQNKLTLDGRFLTLADITNATDVELRTIPNFGRKNLIMVREAVAVFKF